MIGVLAPYQEIEKIVDEVRGEVKETIKVSKARVANAVALAEELIGAGARVLVARGGIADALKAADLDGIPLVNISITAYDVLRAVAEAKKKAPRVCIMAFESMIEGLDEILLLIGEDTSVVTLREGTKIPEAMAKCWEDGEVCFVGGAITCEIARSKDYPSVLIRSGKEAVSIAIHEASRIVKVRRAEEQKRVLLQGALDSMEDGVVVVDSGGRPELWNSRAMTVFGSDDLQASEVFSAFMRDEGLRRLFSHGVSGDAVVKTTSGASIVVSVSPLLTGGDFDGALLNLRDAVRVEALEQKVRAEVHSRGLTAKRKFSDIIGQSRLLRETIAAAQAFAEVDATVLILGESGTGKELFAQAIHNSSSRRNGPYVAVNCAALPESLLESELFGYAPGAFTGATKQGKPGLFELAHKGTLLLDEINELSPNLQGKLLRVLQERVIRRVGGDRVIPVDVRVVACTNRDLVSMTQKREFREDLFFRLDVLRLHLPPLRERAEDVIPLFRFFVKRFSQELSLAPVRLAPEAVEVLSAYPWPGNAREVQNVVQRCLALFYGQVITKERLRTTLSAYGGLFSREAARMTGQPIDPEGDSSTELRRRPRQSLTPEDIRAALEATGGSIGEAAKALGVHRSTLWRHMTPR